jgi:integrase
VVRGKTRKARRTIDVEPAFRPVLAAMTKGKAAGDPLFDYQPKGWRPNTNPAKARIDGLLRRVRQLCQAADVPEVISHSMRGLNATLRTLAGTSHQAIADALGHESFTTTSRYYLDPAAAEQAASRRSHGRLLTA